MSGGGVMLSGWLRKSPPENKLNSRHYSWKKRWFVLKSGRLSGDPNVLEYSKYQTSKKPIKSINLNDCKQIDINVTIPVRHDKKDTTEHFVFAIVTNLRTFYLVADSLREMSSWVHCLCDLCGFSHDSNDKSDLGRQKQTFKAGEPNINVNGNSPAASLLPTTSDVPPAVLPRPENTITALSKPIEPNHPSPVMQNGTVNTSFLTTSENGYDFSVQDASFDNGVGFGPHIMSNHSEMSMDIPMFAPPEDDDSDRYFHLADCETLDKNEQNPSLLMTEKNDERRCSTDSVFAHDDGSDESKEDSPTLPMEAIPQTSRFLQANKARLSSMPDCPPPPPPINVLPHSQYADDDEDDVVDAVRRPSRNIKSRLPPIDDTGLYNVPPGLQREQRGADGSLRWQGSNSSSSYGSAYGGDGRYSGNKLLSPPEYINTQDPKSSGSFSPGIHLSGSASSSYSSPGPLSTSPHLRNQLYDVPSPLSPVFPLGQNANARSNYQSPKSLDRTPVGLTPASSVQDSDVLALQKQLKDFKMLDVGGVSPTQQESTYATPKDLGLSSKTDQVDTNLNTESTYAVPPRPPKPTATSNMPSPAQRQKIPTELLLGHKSSEGLYESPRSHSASSAGSADHATYDTVKQLTPVSPPHATGIRTVPPNSLPPFTRNSVSATNSPLTTPNMTRRAEITKMPSFSNKLSPLIQQSKVSGSAPSLYDVPQPLIKSPGHGQSVDPRMSQSSNTSGESSGMTGSSKRSSAADTSIYDMPRKLSDTPVRPPLQHQDAFHKVDDEGHPSYEKMSSQSIEFNEEDQDPYTIMTSAPTLAMFSSHVPPAHVRLADSFDVPPPVHRDLKPGRKSLGSDGGSSQSGLDTRKKNNSRDSYESDEAVSPPHTSVVHTMPIVNEPKSLQYGGGFSPIGSRSSSITSPQHAKLNDFNSRLSVSPTPPQRPPKHSFSSLSPRSPPMATQISQLPGRPYTPSHESHRNNSQLGYDPSAVPERPPKPANMRMNTVAPMGWDESKMLPKRPPKSSEDHSFVPSRPPKPSMTPSTGDSLFSGSSLHSGSFFPLGPSAYGPSTVVPPPPDADKEIKYIEINAQVQPPADDRNVPSEPSVEYFQLDVGKTRALELSKKERQKMQQRAHSEAHSLGRGKD
ncbi:uncharacterized protein LOC120340515 [Styela clava]